MEESRSAAPGGAVVEARNRLWQVIATQGFGRCSLVTLRSVERGSAMETLRLLVPFDTIVQRRRPPLVRLAGSRAVAQAVADAVERTHGWRQCWTLAAARLELLPWQIEPALAVLSGATRVLLADAVGAGKTIEAGLILSELCARGLVTHALVLTPAGLRAQWADELATRFGLRPLVLDQAALAREAGGLPAGANPWAAAPVVVSSIDLVKRHGPRMAVDRVPIDVLIVDEAHHLTPGSDRAVIVARLARRAPWVLLASATPHTGDDNAFAFLRDIGGTQADRLVVFRHQRPRQALARRARLARVRTSAAEAAMLREMRLYARAIKSTRGRTSAAARLVATIVARRAASSADAVLITLQRRLALLGAGGTIETDDEAQLPWEEVDAGDGDVPSAVLAERGLSSLGEERRRLSRLIELAAAARAGQAKAAWIRRFLLRVREPAIVFSEYRDTVEALAASLGGVAPVAVLHGGLSPSVRRAATAAFTSGAAALLLATDAGGEGLNLQARCRLVINVELPWSPLRLEQRAGRVDRIGQRRRVHAVHLLHADSVEEAVLARLHQRVARLARASAARSDEAGVDTTVDAPHASGVSTFPPLPAWATPPMASAVDEARRLEDVRTLLRLSPPRTGRLPSCIPLSAPRRRDRADSPPRCLRLVFIVPAVDGAGREAGGTVIGVDVQLSRPLPHAGRGLSEIVSALAGHTRVVDAVRAAARQRQQESAAAAGAMADAVIARTAALTALLDRSAVRFHQPALFDDRATRAAAERAGIVSLHRTHLEALVPPLRALGMMTPGAPRLVGAWLLDGAS